MEGIGPLLRMSLVSLSDLRQDADILESLLGAGYFTFFLISLPALISFTIFSFCSAVPV
jgi:hypothetical protein